MNILKKKSKKSSSRKSSNDKIVKTKKAVSSPKIVPTSVDDPVNDLFDDELFDDELYDDEAVLLKDKVETLEKFEKPW